MNNYSHRSICTLISAAGNPDIIQHLSGDVSEYMFVTGFWKRVNVKCGTLFDQFEDENAQGEVLEVILTELRELIKELRDGPEKILFVRGWVKTEKMKPIEVQATRESFVQELEQLETIVKKAADESSTLSFDL